MLHGTEMNSGRYAWYSIEGSGYLGQGAGMSPRCHGAGASIFCRPAQILNEVEHPFGLE